MRIEELAEELLTSPDVSGLTFSGGEPMLQAQALAHVAELARRQRSLSLITFTGYSYEHLLASDPCHSYQELLAQSDVLVDGPYIQERNDGIGLRGSNNQRIIHLTSTLTSEALELTPRMVEMQISNGEAQIVGIPTLEIQRSLDKALSMPLLMKAIYEWV
jgi:anaerobic ribonucleoside-triphosphate reductase activating protein